MTDAELTPSEISEDRRPFACRARDPQQRPDSIAGVGSILASVAPLRVGSWLHDAAIPNVSGNYARHV